MTICVQELGGFHYLPEVAERLRCSEKKVRRLIEAGKLAGSKHGGRVIVFERSIQEYLVAIAERGIEPT